MAKSKLIGAIALLCGFLFAGLPALGQVNGAQPRQTVAEANAIIGPNDVLDVEVFDTPELSLASAHVSNDGTVTLPVLGIVQLDGLNANQAARKIETALRTRGIMLQPHVTVSIVEYAAQNATLLGEVKVPGVYPTTGDRRMLDLIALAGGFSSSAGRIVTIAHRDDPRHPVIIHVFPKAEELGSQRNPVIQPGDTIMVGRAGIIYILGDVKRPGGFLVDNGEHISLLEALSLSGGWNREASLSKVELIRKAPGGHKEITLDLKHILKGKQANLQVEDGDILFIPSSVGKTVAYQGMQAVVTAAQQVAVFQAYP